MSHPVVVTTTQHAVALLSDMGTLVLDGGEIMRVSHGGEVFLIDRDLIPSPAEIIDVMLTSPLMRWALPDGH